MIFINDYNNSLYIVDLVKKEIKKKKRMRMKLLITKNLIFIIAHFVMN